MDAQGRELQARIKEVVNNEVTIKRTDGRLFTVPIATFDLRTQQILRNWNERAILKRIARATLRAVDVRQQVRGKSDQQALYFRISAGKAMIDVNNISGAIKHLSETTELWRRSKPADWAAHQAKHLLGYAMLLEKPGPEGEKLFVEGMEGMLKSQADLGSPKGVTLMMREAAERMFLYFKTKHPEQSARWKQENEKFQAQVQLVEKSALNLGRMKKRMTEHFILASPYSSIGDYTRTAEKTWQKLAEIIPTLQNDFKKGGFRTPDGQNAAKDQYDENGQFKFLLVLADRQTIDPIAGTYIKTISDRKKRDAARDLAGINGFIEDEQNRFLVAQVGDPKEYTDPDNNFTFHRLIHNVPAALLKLTIRTTQDPHWLSSGIGYHFEHELTGTASVHYVGMDYVQAGLRRNTDWHRVVRNLRNSGTLPNMRRMIWGGDRKAEDYGYMWALVEMLLSTPEKQILLGDFILQTRQNRTFMNEKEVALWFGYEDPEAMSRALGIFVLSKAFEK